MQIQVLTSLPPERLLDPIFSSPREMQTPCPAGFKDAASHSCVALGKAVSLSQAPFPHLQRVSQNGSNESTAQFHWGTQRTAVEGTTQSSPATLDVPMGKRLAPGA